MSPDADLLVGRGLPRPDAGPRAGRCSTRRSEVTGSIEVGKYADLVVLEQDPTAVEPADIAAIPLSQTRLAGQGPLLGLLTP